MLKNLRIVPSFLAAVFLLGCDAEPAPEASSAQAPALEDTQARGLKLGKHPRFRINSCKGFCGGSAFGFCWCDDQCEDYGDCCHDYEPVCNPKPRVCGTRGAEPCAEGSYCNFPIDNQCGRTDLGGTCEPTPEFCTREYAPVCGCDGKTYGNECMANANGISVDYLGECRSVGVSCGARAGDTCGDDEYCAYQPGQYCGAADAESVCKPRPEICTEEYKPVCACNGKTYANACKAAAAGHGVNTEGACESEPEPEPGVACGAELGDTCGENEFCAYEPGLQCGWTDGTAFCAPIPKICTKEYKPVCACNGKTYANTCLANADGQGVNTEGECGAPKPAICGGAFGTECVEGQYCAFPEPSKCGLFGGLGSCQPKPEACIQVYKPVCGCDGKTYGNGCIAASAGVSVAADGECEPESTQCTKSSQCGQGQWCNAGTCEPLTKPIQYCLEQSECGKGLTCDTSLCLSGCGNNPGPICPAVCLHACVPALTE